MSGEEIADVVGDQVEHRAERSQHSLSAIVTRCARNRSERDIRVSPASTKKDSSSLSGEMGSLSGRTASKTRFTASIAWASQSPSLPVLAKFQYGPAFLKYGYDRQQDRR